MAHVASPSINAQVPILCEEISERLDGLRDLMRENAALFGYDRG